MLSFVNVVRRILREHSPANRLSSVDLKGNVDDVVGAVKAWLTLPKNTRWLIIYDNYNNPKLPGNTDPREFDIQKFLPEVYRGAIMITTRSPEVKLGHRVRVEKLKDVRESL